jgi:response regulator RpfG family c-di-GMP phosphodiesterase
LLASFIILAEDWENTPEAARDQIERCRDTEPLLSVLVEHGLLTRYQAERVRAGSFHGLILGNYRVLDQIGAGGMGIVYRAEHLRLRQPVAIKVMQVLPSRDSSYRDLRRFYSEVRAVAQLQHPNVVRALDAGEVHGDSPDQSVLHYYVMEYIEGEDLESYVEKRGPLPPAKACDIIYQVASGLVEAQQRNLVHRDVKPSNILLTPDGRAKLLDFGLVRLFTNRLTKPGTVLGTIDYIAPEQAYDSSTVDIRADIYGLGGTLFWLLTGRPPFDAQGSVAQELIRRQHQEAPSARTWRPDVSPQLDAVLARMMACKPADRYQTPKAVMNALVAFLKPESREQLVMPAGLAGKPAHAAPARADGLARLHTVLIVDDEPGIRTLCKYILQKEGIACDEAEDGFKALAAMNAKSYDLVLLDWCMPGMNGLEVCRKLRENPPAAHLKVLMLSGYTNSDDLAEALLAGADDYLVKPFTPLQLIARTKAALRLQDAQDHTDLINRHLLSINHELEQNLNARDSDLIHARNALVLALAKLVGCRDAETGSHLLRIQRYARRLAEEAVSLPDYAASITTEFIQLLECTAPLHDIGKVGLPDHILFKECRLDPDERIIMQTHTILGAETLKEVARQHGAAVDFLEMAIDIARHHHERWDGQGYPDRIAGNAIPLAARIVTISDVYDALRSKRPYKPALSHEAAIQVMTQASPGQFDPSLLEIFKKCAADFERIFRELTD